jgi:hypothetical protein
MGSASDFRQLDFSKQINVDWDEIPPSPMRMFFIELRHFVISSIARFFSDGTSNRVMLSLTERTRSCGVLGLFERLKRKAMLSPYKSFCRITRIEIEVIRRSIL